MILAKKCMLCVNSIDLLASVMEKQIVTVVELLVGRTSGFNQGKPISILEHSCGIFGGPSNTKSTFLFTFFDFPLPVAFHHCSILSFIFTLVLSEGQAGEGSKSFNKAILL